MKIRDLEFEVVRRDYVMTTWGVVSIKHIIREIDKAQAIYDALDVDERDYYDDFSEFFEIYQSREMEE